MLLLRGIIPLLRIFVRRNVIVQPHPAQHPQKTTDTRQTEKAQQTMRRIGLKLIAEKKASILAATGQGSIEKKHVIGRDLLTLLIKANMATDIPESQRLTDEEVLARELFLLMYSQHGC